MQPPRRSSRPRLEAASELEVDVGEIDAGDAIGMPALDELACRPRSGRRSSPLAIASAPVVVPQAPAPGATG